MTKRKAMLSLDIGGTHVRAGFVDAAYALTDFSVTATRDLFGPSPLEDLVTFARQYIERHAERIETTAISIGFPASIDKARRTVLSTPNIPGMNNLPVADAMEKALQIPVVLGRDVNMLFSYDCYDLQLDTRGIGIGCYYGTGLGNTIAINGEILYGKNGVAAELGHIPYYGGTTRCGCGNIGCVEHFASGRYLVALTEKHFPETHIKDVFVKHADSPVIAEFLDGLSLPAATEITLLDPDYVIIGGGIPHMEAFPKAAFEACVRRHTRKPYPEANLKLVYSRPAQENGVIGAGIYAYRHVDKIK